MRASRFFNAVQNYYLRASSSRQAVFISRIALAVALIYIALFNLLLYEVRVTRAVFDAPGINLNAIDVAAIVKPNPCSDWANVSLAKQIIADELDGVKTLLPIARVIGTLATENCAYLKNDFRGAVEMAAIRGHEIINMNREVIAAANNALPIIETLNPLFTWIVGPYLNYQPIDRIFMEAEQAFYLPQIVLDRERKTTINLSIAKNTN